MIYVARNKAVYKYSATGKNYGVLYEHRSRSSGYFTCIAVTPDGRIILGNNGESSIAILKPGGNLVKTIQTRSRPISIAVVNNELAAVCDNEGYVDVISLTSGQETLHVKCKCLYASALCYDKGTDSLLVLGKGSTSLYEGVVEQYSLATGAFIACVVCRLFTPVAMTFAGNDTLVVGGYRKLTAYSASV